MLLYQYFGVIIISNTFLANKIFSEIENENNEKNNVTFNAVVKIISKMVVTDIHEIMTAILLKQIQGQNT